MNDLHIGTVNDAPFSLPVDALTTMIAIVGRRGSGKTTTALVLAEEFIKAQLPVVLMDPLGVHWGLRSSANGEAAGLPVTILGGAHGDLPLAETAGAVVAELVVEQPGAYIVDLSGFGSRSAERRFSTDFAEKLYRLKQKEPGALGLIVDEADTFAPQRTPKGEERMLGAFEAIARRGRVYGLGMVLITQRPAVLNKNVLTQAEVMIAHQVTAPQDRAALKEWAEGNATPAEVATFINSLASLGVGQAWLWSPAWLGIFERIDVRRRDTYDSSATPKAGQVKVEPRVLAEVDLEAIRARMAEAVERIEADDPKKLKAEIVKLRRELAAKSQHSAPEPCDHEPVIEELRRDLAYAVDYGQRQASALEAIRAGLSDTAIEVDRALQRPAPKEVPVVKEAVAAAPVRRASAALERERPDAGSEGAHQHRRDAQPRDRGPEKASGSAGALKGPEQRVLNAIAWFNSIGIDEPAQRAIAFLAGYSWGGGFFKPRANLKTQGLVEYAAGERISLTAEGRTFADKPDAPFTTDDLHRAVLGQLKGPERRVLEPLLNAWPDGMTHESLAEAAGYTMGGGYFKPRANLKTWGLVDYIPGGVIASDILFPEGAR